MGKTKSGKSVVALADCTWHGVQWALTSVSGKSILDDALRKWIEDPGEILDYLRREMIISQKWNVEESEGWFDQLENAMDVSLFILSKDKKELKFAWARNSLYISTWLRSGIQEIKWDRKSIWYDIKDNKSSSNNKHKYTTHTRQLEWEDITIIMSSDWFMDQFGGNKGTKFMKKNFKTELEKLINIQLESSNKEYKKDIPFQQIWDRLEDTLEKYMNEDPNSFQVDDIAVIWIRINPEK